MTRLSTIDLIKLKKYLGWHESKIEMMADIFDSYDGDDCWFRRCSVCLKRLGYTPNPGDEPKTVPIVCSNCFRRFKTAVDAFVRPPANTKVVKLK